MEIDSSTVKALASPTRIQILKATLNGRSTTTGISEDLEKTKSTVSTHLETLTDAGLLEKDEEEGRRRVVYTPTRKAESIIKGRRKKMQFSLATGFVAMIAGGAAFWQFFDPINSNAASRQSADSMGTLSMDAAKESGTAASSGIPELDNLFLAAGVMFFSISAASFAYGYTMNQLKSES